MMALQTVEIEPEWALAPIIITVAKSRESQASLLSQFSIPRWPIWIPFMRWILERSDVLDETVRSEVAELMRIWQEKTPYGSIYRREIGKLALKWLTPLERWKRNRGDGTD